MKAYLMKLCNGDLQTLAVPTGATPGPDAAIAAEPHELQEPAHLSIALTTVAGIEYAREA